MTDCKITLPNGATFEATSEWKCLQMAVGYIGAVKSGEMPEDYDES